ncbi:hypothetical protein LOAG_13462, partial [Loa loa]
IYLRKADVKHTNNEACSDVIEEIDAIIDQQCATVFSEIQGYISIDCCYKLSSIPDLMMALINPRLLDVVSFPLCVSERGTASVEALPIVVYFRINQLAVSGLKVNRLDLYSEKYKPFKGVKYITKTRRFQVYT